ncbi:YqiA/YcfP family alpha/beta fold hydrolase [Marinobacteraceae bacterium S3BR75-40.1]
MSSLLLYLHGFNSSPLSVKAGRLEAFLAASDYDLELQVPQLHYDPDRAIEQADSVIAAARAVERPVALMGSSLGGYYAAWLSTRWQVPAVLVNPAVYPYRLLADYVGPQENPYTGERYTLTHGHRHQLQALDAGDHFRPEQLFLLLETADETLDYREALLRYPGARTWVRPGGSHAFDGFERCLPAALAFLFDPSHFPAL